MDPVPPSGDAEPGELNELLSLFDAPAYIRRARGVEQALEHLLALCRRVREEYLQMPRLLVGQLRDLAGDWTTLAPLLADTEQVAVCAGLHRDLAPQLRLPLAPSPSRRVLRRKLLEVVRSLGRFNERWADYLGKVDRTFVNELREAYNRCYLVEKACALRSDVLARRGFTPLPPLDVAELEQHLPLLPVPRLAG